MKSLKSELTWDSLTDSEFQSAFRMSKESLIYLKAEIDHFYGVLSEEIEPALLLTLWLLGNTEPLSSANYYFDCDDDVEGTFRTYLGKLLTFSKNYIRWPNVSECRQLTDTFSRHFNIANTMGAVGSLYVPVDVHEICDDRQQTLYYNERFRDFAVVLQIACDDCLLVRDAYVGVPGSRGAKEVLRGSPLFSKLSATDCRLLGGTEHRATLSNLVTPLDHETEGRLNDEQEMFNTLHSRGMSTIEQTFTTMRNRFPRLRCRLKPNDLMLVATAVCTLHNMTNVLDDNVELYA